MPIGIPPYLKFPASARAAIVSAEAEAERHCREALSTARLQSNRWSGARTLDRQDVARVRTALTTYAEATVRAFAKHACEAARTGHLPIDRVAGLVDDRIEAIVAYGYGLDRDKSEAVWPAMDSHWGGTAWYTCLRELRAHIKGSVVWREFLADLEAVASELAQSAPASSDAPAPTVATNAVELQDAPTPKTLPALPVETTLRPNPSRATIEWRKRTLKDYRKNRGIRTDGLAQELHSNKRAIQAVVAEDWNRFDGALQKRLLEKIGVTEDDWYRERVGTDGRKALNPATRRTRVERAARHSTRARRTARKGG